MTDVDLETRNFLHELDTFGQPPPPQRIISEADHHTISKDFELKLHHINLDKQMHFRTGKLQPGTSVPNASRNGCAKAKDKENANEITKNEIKAWKEQVMSASRPLNLWYEQQHQLPPVQSNRSILRLPKSAESSPRRVSPSHNYTPIAVATVSGENTVFSVANAKKSDHMDSGSSVSPLSASSNTETSHSSISTNGSYGVSSNEQYGTTYRATPCAAEGYFSPITSTKTYYHSGPPVRRRPYSAQDNAVNLDKNHNQWAPYMSRNSDSTRCSSTSSGTLTSAQNPSVMMQNICRQSSASSLPWRKQSFDSIDSTDSGVSIQRKKYDEITSDLEKQLKINRKSLGICGICKKPVLVEGEATCALGQIYHNNCFVCDVCGRTLRGKKIYKTKGKTYCEEDYLYSGVHENAERCDACSQPIMEMVLQAVGKSYHPGCFRCIKCRVCLDGIPFAVDSQGNVYCTDDYHKMFAPRCARCHQPIMPTNKVGETVRVVAINRDYHIDCYACEGCGTQLTDEVDKRCYPLNDHLLCKRCHIHWARTGGDKQPITDL